jgi:hypothetical protein|nr:MAG TPA: hypothetical protein [Caudoviricetes sp.]
MVFEDRVSKYPGRWTMVKSDGTSEIVTLVRNDEPIKEGTPINAATLNELSTVAGAINAKEEAVSAAQTAASERAKAEQAAANAANAVKVDLKEYSDKAVTSASNAAESEKNAKASETESAKNLQGTKEYFEQVRTITIGAQGWYATPEALKAAVPVGENGWWAVVGTTDTIWTWDGDTGAWKDSVQKADMSDFYTQAQVDALLAEYAYSKTETDAKFALTADKITRLERMMNMDGKLVFSGAGVCTGGTTTMAIPSTVDYAEIVSAIPAIGRSGTGWANSSEYNAATTSNAIGTASDFGHAKVVRGGSAAVPITSLTMLSDGILGSYNNPYAKIENTSVSMVSVAFASDGTLSVSGGGSGSQFVVYGYQYL